ncbi:MAG: hypothetical protein K5683_02080 [Prevotella sp.]|nr:hypothetical protein [Prevotella sp.]
MLAVQNIEAINVPYAQSPVDGKTYMLVSRMKPASYTVPTSWDGSLYLQGYNLQNITDAAITAKKNDDGSWYFYKQTTTTYDDGTTETADTYLGIPGGTNNVRIQELAPVTWYVEQSDVTDYFLLKAGPGQGNELTENGYLHLNNGGEYLVITEPSSQWFPDLYGGVQYLNDEEGNPIEAILDEYGFPIPLNTISRYWTFVELDDVPAYSLKVQLYALLQDIEDNYLVQTDYQAGFQGAIDAALPYYNKEEFTQEDLDAAKAIITAKMNLYKEIQTALTLLASGTPSSMLSDAIAEATRTFNESNDTAALEAAQQALKEAEKTYAESSGELTPLITNNSFEDLSSQGGAMSSSVSDAPFGWNVFVNGQQAQTASELRAAGITGWHGVNDDADGAKDGSYAFGLWNGGIPEYEVSQTLTGLENGSYTIAAAVMVGANGNGSRRTTQRIFGNLNAKYFGADYNYDSALLDQREVYAFEGLEEPQTDRQLQEMTVRAFVYDGTLTFGLRTNGNIAAAKRESSNSAGGDGWFKLDNFRIFKEGYIQDDALEIYQHFASLIDNLSGEQMQASVKEQAVAATDIKINTGSTQDEIISAIIKLKDLYPTVQASVTLYQNLLAAIDNGTMALIEYEHSASADDFSDLLMEAEDMYEEAVAGEEEVNDIIRKIEEGIEELKATAITFGDITYLLKNPSFEDMSNQGNSPSGGSANPPAGWTLTLDGQLVTSAPALAWCGINEGDAISVMLEDGTEVTHQYTDGTHLWGIWDSNIPEVELSQSFTNMPAGTYTLQADVMVQYNWAGDCTTTQRIFANNYVQMWGAESSYSELNLPADATSATALTYAGYYCAPGQEGLDNSDLLHPMSVTFEVGDNGEAKIGFRTNGVNIDGLKFSDGEGALNGQGWFKVDNFRLSYDSAELTSVSGIRQQNEGTTTFYTIDGRQLLKPHRGLNIMRTGEKTVKIFVK